MPIVPKGAVTSIAKTAIDKTKLPQGSPRVSGTELIAAAPAFSTHLISTSAPTRTNSTASAPIQSFPNFSEILFDTFLSSFVFNMQATLINAKSPDNAILPLSISSHPF